MQVHHPLSVAVLQRLLILDPVTGRLYWRARGDRRWDERWAGTEALALPHNAGYRVGTILRRKYLAHRVVFALTNGRWPTDEVDHIDRDRTNNAPANLREATRRDNQRNSRKPNRTSAFIGVTWHARDRRWQAQCRDASGRPTYLGLFLSEEAAARARDEFAAKQHGEFARLNFGGPL